MATSDRFNILIVDPDTESRGRLKQAALALTTFNKVHNSNSLTDALSKTRGGEAIDVVVMSYRFDTKDIIEFIANAKKTPAGESWAFVTVLKSSEQQNEIIADSVVSGIDGFLFEPYSADNLREMAEITAKVKRQNAERRKRVAMHMLLSEVAKHIDAVSFYKAKGRDAVIATKKLEEACARLTKFKQDGFDMYVEELIKIFENIAPPPSESYTGVSERVRQRLETKRLAQLESEYNQP